jgi:hypothetical protein
VSTSGAMSDFLERAVMRHCFRNTAMPAPPATLHLALYTGGVPADDGTGATEVAVGNYARLALTTGTSGTGAGSIFTDPTATGGQVANVANTDFPAASGANWGSITGWALLDAASGGNMWWRGDIPSTAVDINDILRFIAAQLTITVG